MTKSEFSQEELYNIQNERHVRREQTIREIIEKMRKATDLAELVKITTEELGQRFAAEYALIELGT